MLGGRREAEAANSGESPAGHRRHDLRDHRVMKDIPGLRLCFERE
jgi:hypothetical protein